MSWYSDKESFDEYDPPYCKYCNDGVGGSSYEECKRCQEEHNREEQENPSDDEEGWG